MSAQRAGSAYLRRFVPAMAGYVVLLVAAVLGAQALGDSPWRFVVMLVPALPLILVIRAVARYLRDADELQRRIQLEAVAVGFAVGSLVTVAYGLLQTVGAPLIPLIWVWPVYAASWLVGLLIARRRY